MPRKKRKRAERPTIHPRNRYSDSPPDFALLASLYPSFEPFVFYSRDGRPRIDWTDFNATRELTRILLLHDHGLNWWIPDGQLCPTVPNRSNYIHWVEDLLSSEIITKGDDSTGHIVKGFDIGTGANCIYPLLGASLLGWNFVGSDVTDVALEWAERNVKSNPHISELIEIRKVQSNEPKPLRGEELNDQLVDEESTTVPNGIRYEEDKDVPSSTIDVNLGENKNYCGPPVLLGVVKDGETFDFCMCNPPFFESMAEVGMNPKTSCGGTPEEMVCPGGEHAFVTRIIEDSSVLKQSFRWYTSMLGKKANLKNLISKLWEVGVTIVKTTEFVQGQTCRWGLAWSFVPPAKKIMSPPVVEKNVLTFMLEGLPRQFSALHVLQEVESFFISKGASCKSNASLFTVDVRLSIENQLQEMLSCAGPSIELYFRISVFQQIPCTLLVKGSLQHKQNPVQGAFSSSLQQLEEVLKSKFCR